MKNVAILGKGFIDVEDKIKSVLESISISSISTIDIIKFFEDSKDFIKEIERDCKYDIVIMEAFMPDMDAYSVVQYVRAKYDNVYTIVTIDHPNDNILEYIASTGSFILFKPYNIGTFRNMITYLLNKQEKKESNFNDAIYEDVITENISTILKEIGFTASRRGYPYSIDAIKILLKSKDQYKVKLTGVYEEIAKKYNVTPTSVERCIRFSIESVFKNGNILLLETIFGYSISKASGKPYNGDFLFTIAEYIRRGM